MLGGLLHERPRLGASYYIARKRNRVELHLGQARHISRSLILRHHLTQYSTTCYPYHRLEDE